MPHETDDFDINTDRKISTFPATTTFPTNTIVTLVADGVNYQMTLADFQSQFSAVGTIASVGTGLPIYNASGSVSQIRTIEALRGLYAEQIESAGIEISDGLTVTLTSTTAHICAQTSEIIFCAGANIVHNVTLLPSAATGSLVRIYTTIATASVKFITSDASNLIIAGASSSGATGKTMSGFRTITLRKTPSNWMQENTPGTLT